MQYTLDMNAQITPNQFDRTARMLVDISGEDEGRVEMIGDSFYYFGSELATLRLLKKYRHCDNASQDFSQNYNSYYFSLDVGKALLYGRG